MNDMEINSWSLEFEEVTVAWESGSMDSTVQVAKKKKKISLQWFKCHRESIG